MFGRLSVAVKFGVLVLDDVSYCHLESHGVGRSPKAAFLLGHELTTN